MSDQSAAPAAAAGPTSGNAPSGGAGSPGSFMDRAKDRLSEMFGCDLRSLAALRVGLGLTILEDLWTRSRDLATFYSDDGVLPREALLEHFSRDIYVSLHMASGTPAFQGVLFAIAAVAAVCLTVGYRTWLATLISWILLVSLQVRMPLVLQSGDVVLRLLLFWSLFLPLGARASVDALQSPAIKAPPQRITSVATFGLMVQLSSIYIFTAILKNGAAWWNGTASIYALQIDHFATPFGKWMLTLPDPVLHFGTGATLFWEFGGPAFLLIPFFFGPARTLTIFGFYALHIGFRAALDIGLFSQICMVDGPHAGLVLGPLHPLAPDHGPRPGDPVAQERRGCLLRGADHQLELQHGHQGLQRPPRGQLDRSCAPPRSEVEHVRAVPHEGRRLVRDAGHAAQRAGGRPLA